MTDEPLISTPATPQHAPALVLLPERAGASHFSLQHFSGVATLALIFLASAGFTVAYLSSGGQVASAESQAASVEVPAAAAADPFASLSLAAEGVYVFDLATNRILFSKNPDTQFALASLIKVPLVLAVSEVLKPDAELLIPPHSTPDGAGVRIQSGLNFTAGDIIDFTLVASSNEGAAILTDAAEAGLRKKYPLATRGAATLWRMNDIAKNLGLTTMVFLNTNGLDESDTQAGAYGSARDVALLFGYAAVNAPGLFEQTSRDAIKIRARSGETVIAVNTDEALPAIPGLIMGKTGTTELAGGNLALVFEAGPTHPVVAVVLHSTPDGRFADMKALVAAAIASVGAGQ